MQLKLVLVSLVVLLANGCSTIKNDALTAEESAQLSQKTLVLSRYNELPDFPAQTALNVQFGLIGYASAVDSGNTIIANNNIADPAYSIAQKLAAGSATKHQVNLVELEQSVALDTEIGELVKRYSNYDYILDVKTLSWGSIYFPSDWDSYRVNYATHARLIETKSKKVIVEGSCSHFPEYADTNDAPSYEELEDGTGIRKSLANTVDVCVDYIRTHTQLPQAQ
ncbi:hypothetical protein [Motilimonas sp. KMU-193]|uniref:hypothetical protein n=1 Tax=Motilimonas sp. KMU-193 TaxID=3388668 RepID=UPI00396B1746